MKEWIDKALRPVQVVVDVVLQAAQAVAQAGDSLYGLPFELYYLTNVFPLIILQYTLQIILSSFSQLIGAFGGENGILSLFASLGRAIANGISRLLGLFSKKTMTLSADGSTMLKSWEGLTFLATPTYLTINGVTEPYPTIGWGHYMSDGKNYVVIDGKQYTRLDEDLAERLLRQDNANFDTALNGFLSKNNLTLTQKQYDACFIDMYQKGDNGWPNSPAARYVIAKNYTNYDDCVEAFCLTVGGSPPNSWGHERRRTAEAILFFSGIYQLNEPGFAPHRYWDNSGNRI